MTTFLALLRGVNVGGVVLKMDVLRDLLESSGFRDVRTYVQSGNAVFRAKESKGEVVASKIRKALRDSQGRDFPVLVKDAAAWKAIASENPFVAEGLPIETLHVTLLSAAPSADAIAKATAIDGGADRLRFVGTSVYLHTPHGYGRSKLSNNVLERALKVEATTRNWKTVRALLEMIAEPA